ncbi:MAG: transposase [Bifidobacteriaceae bacterium]|nr:transposase [Bifidobacteriaceae bacterium]
MVAALTHDTGMVIGQVHVDAKTHEIPAARQLLGLLDLNDVAVTMDATHTQRATVELIRSRDGQAVFTVKDNQCATRLPRPPGLTLGPPHHLDDSAEALPASPSMSSTPHTRTPPDLGPHSGRPRGRPRQPRGPQASRGGEHPRGLVRWEDRMPRLPVRPAAAGLVTHSEDVGYEPAQCLWSPLCCSGALFQIRPRAGGRPRGCGGGPQYRGVRPPS